VVGNPDYYVECGFYCPLFCPLYINKGDKNRAASHLTDFMDLKKKHIITSGRDILAFLLFTGIIVVLLSIGTNRLGYNWQWYRVPKYIYTLKDGTFYPGRLLQGVGLTIKISVTGLGLSFLFGLVTALLRLSHSVMGRALSRVYLELIRNTPLLIQLFFIYFVVSPIIQIGPFFSAVLALSLFEGAYASEIIRGGIVSVPKGQWESAYSLGLGIVNTYRFVILPQAFRQILPTLTSQGISLIKDSALVSTIAIYDLTMQGRAIVSETFLAFEIWFTVAGIYLILTLTLSMVVHVLESRFSARESQARI
jgi:polar amino acid transport system permease protein